MYRINWTLIAALWLTYFLNYVDRQVIFSLLPALKAQIPMSSIEMGWIGSLFIWFYSLGSPLGGKLADRYGQTRMILLSLLLWSAATLATGMSGSVAMLLVWRALMGITEALYFPAAVSLLGALHLPEVRSRAIAMHGSAQFAGVAAGGWFGGWMTEHFGWRSSFWVLAVSGVVWSAGLMVVLRRMHVAKPAGDRKAGRGADLLTAHYAALAVAFFAICAMLWMLYAWLPLFLHDRYRLSLSESGLQATLYLQMGSLVGILAGGALGDWVSRRSRLGRLPLVAGGLLACTPFAVWVLASNVLQVAVTAGAGFGLFSGIMLANTMASAYDMVPERSYGMAAGMLTLIGGLAGGLAILFAGAWKDSFGMEALMRWGAAGAAISALLLMAVAWRYPKPHTL